MKNDSFENKFLTDISQELIEIYFDNIKNNIKTWDCVVLTASNTNQAEGYKKYINERLDKKIIPSNIDYLVIEDPDGKRVGSGGATINVFFELLKKYKSLNDKKILIINSGGDSKRIPEYSNIGKIFSPVQRLLNDSIPSTLFDENMILANSIVTRINFGCLIMAGDVLLSFNPIQIDFFNTDIGSIGINELVDTGCNHGVFKTDDINNVLYFLHKQNKETLYKYNCVNKNNKVSIDTGLLYLSSKYIIDLIDTIEQNNIKNIFINDKTRLNLYNDLLIPAAKNTKKDLYINSPGEIELNDNIYLCRNIIWNMTRKYIYKVAKLSPAKFIHYGTNKELKELLKNNKLDFLHSKANILTNYKDDNNYLYNSYIDKSSIIKEQCYIENSYVDKNVVINNNTILSNVICENITIPENVVLNTIKLNNNKYVTRIFGINDNPKKSLLEEQTLLNSNMLEICNYYDIDINTFIENTDNSLWESKLYLLTDTPKESVDEAINLYNIITKNSNKTKVINYINAIRISLKESFLNSDNSFNIENSKKIEIKVIKEKYFESIKNKIDSNIVNKIITQSKYSNIIKDDIEKITSDNYRENLYKYKLLNNITLYDKAFEEINHLVEINNKTYEFKTFKDKSTISLPIRVNFGGGWTDTIPYCIENGGSVFNGAFTLNNSYPIKCEISKIKEKKLIIESKDLDNKIEIKDIKELITFNNGNDDFSLVKSCLITTNFINKKYTNINDLLSFIGSGIKIITNVENIPKGSGLGTSSILCACVIKTIFDFSNIEINENEVNQLVLKVEQEIGTGGGWQDQMGSLIPGLKLLKSESTKKQNIKIDQINITNNIEDFFNNRFMIIYSGQRRAAKKLVKNIMGEYILSNPIVVESLKEIKKTSIKMFDSIKEEKFEEFSILMNKHFELSKKLDKDSSNISIELIIESISDLIESKMICGAGGGGFIQIILKTGVSKKTVIDKIEKIYEECGVKCYETKLCK